ncbi:glutathione S-transferase omega-1 [Sigmodon hispidus]
MVLKAKGIWHKIVSINLNDKPEWFLKKNPSRLVPVLEDSKGRLITESVIICEYLDEEYPKKKLFPDDPYKKAYQKMILESFSKVPPLGSSFIRAKNDEDHPDLEEKLRKELQKLEKDMSTFESTFSSEDSLSMTLTD